jgi:hypothetical protein
LDGTSLECLILETETAFLKSPASRWEGRLDSLFATVPNEENQFQSMSAAGIFQPLWLSVAGAAGLKGSLDDIFAFG